MAAEQPSPPAPGRLRRWGWNAVVLLGTAWVTQLVLAVLFENHLIYYPESAGDWDAPARYPGQLEDVLLATPDGATIHGWYFLREKPRATLLFFHGNAGNLSHRLDWMLALSGGLDVDLLGIDYHGYGRSQGSPSEAALYADAEAAWDELTVRRRIPPGRIVVYGKSLGGAPACELAKRHPCAGLILQSCFTSIPAMANHLLPLLPARLLVRHQFDNLGKVASIATPKLIVHSATDEVIPFFMGEALFQAAAEPKTFLRFDHVGHNDLIVDKRAELLDAYRKFLARVVR